MMKRQAPSAVLRLEANRRINQLEAELDEKEAQARAESRQITRRREELYLNIEERLKQDSSEHTLFTIRWSVV